MPRHRGKRSGGFRSKFEARLAEEMRAVGGTYEQTVLVYQPGPRKYTPDWVLPNGIVLEIKGHLSSADRSKMLLVKAAHPHLDIRFLFQRANNTLNKNSATTYGLWATQHGFRWAEGRLPATWAHEGLLE